MSGPFWGRFRGRRILVTGHTGFKGSWLSLWLTELGAEVTGLALAPNTIPSHFELIRLADVVKHNEVDIRDGEAVARVFATARPEIVFHLAAQPLVRESYERPKETFDTNIGGTVNLLEAVRLTDTVRACVVVTSDKCYENREWVWGYRENDSLGGFDPYSASKGAAEIVTGAYVRSFFSNTGEGRSCGVATVRAGNVVGGGDWAKDRIISDCVRFLVSGQPILLRNPDSTRPWQHVLDPLAGYLLLAARLEEDPRRFAGPWNFGPVASPQVTVEQIAKRFIREWGDGRLEVRRDSVDSRHEARFLQLAVDKAQSELSWEPILDGEEAIEWTVDWYRSWNRATRALVQISLQQIHDYMTRAERQQAVWTE